MTILQVPEDREIADPLTGLVGRDQAAASLGQWLERGEKIYALLLGLRRFDALNLAYGAAAGDAALSEVARRLKHFARTELNGNWLLARSGGDKFLLLTSEQGSRERWQLNAVELLELLARPMATYWGTLRLSPRAALIRGTNGDNTELLLDRLGQGLASAMAQPSRRLVWADGEATRLGARDLVQALHRNEIEVVYQPQFSCKDERLTGAEALARWNHPKYGLIGAGALFALAERTEHVTDLTQHIARLALCEARRWPMDLRLSLNLTPDDLAVPGFAPNFVQLARQCGFPAWRLTLEVTEQVLLADVSQAAQVLELLAAEGMRIALDDFGAGFCNFRYLKVLPLHYLKLDRSMIDGVASDARDLAVLRGIIAMAGALELKVIAEGIENEAQRIVAANEGCDSYQGFLRAQPMGGQAFYELAKS